MALLSVEEALAQLLAAARLRVAVESRPLGQALGAYLAEDIVAAIDVPPADNSAMDGYAVASVDVPGPGIRLPVSQRIAAGRDGGPLQPGSAARIFTGANLPPGADAVVMQEDCERLAEGEVLVRTAVRVGQNVRPRGQDIARGQRLLSRGQRIDAARLGLLAAVGLAAVPVYRPLTVALLSTGDELAEPGQPLAPGQIYNSNRPLLSAQLRTLGFQVVDFGIVRDTLEATLAACEQAAAAADCVISTGGVSAGEEDHVRSAIERGGELALWKLAIKPGKPLAFGHFRGVPFFGLPGNPASAFVTFSLLARPFLLTLQGAAEVMPAQWHLPAAFAWPRPGRRQEYLRVRIEDRGEGPRVTLYPNQSSGVLASVAWCNALAVIPPGEVVAPGDAVAVIPLSELTG